MLPPIPHGLVPVTAQHDPVKPKALIAPITPAKESTKGSTLGLEDDEGSTAQERALEEQRRQHQRQREKNQAQAEAEAEAYAELEISADESEQEEQGEKTGLSRKGVWVNIKV
ncbi:MAG TPA: aspartate-semialdehyde dehydrogenase [Thiopseudomonas sp.]|nr:aspartate-semialdehyde dehydrogenase [Thiopseudomonas sp.]HKM36535.1 aspartate-semialdehyde dehydrogenase [Thiopseudomonas sp.]